ncbi:helix-turn-helix transcriptional regulator [Acinetobacter sp. MB5]|uniref:helix-turn-helix transcriptional regulator n=1 Tax=Acinetobacter sp. MB5 TaxID=2069438 RepID=UPI000DD07907|nr:helix-turn-helix transcriptional regulator [Acinetobacter sp. MB5]
MDQNQDVKNFLLKHRAKINPEEYGFNTLHRRVKGLRREEVAQLAAISVSWYTWLEQGRDISISNEAIKRIGQVLKLTADEQEYFEAILFKTQRVQVPSKDLSHDLVAMVDALNPHPAFIRRENMDIVYWNKSTVNKIFDWSKIPENDRNSLKLMFINEEYKSRIPDWQEAARNTIASFRSYYALSKEKEKFENVITDLKSRSVEFSNMWEEHEVRKTRQGKKAIMNFKGELKRYAYSTLKPEGTNDVFLIFYNEY